MATLTSTLRADLQADLAIGSSEAVFTNDELDRLYTRADGDYEKTIVLAMRQLMQNASKFNDYTAGQTSEKKSQIRDNLQKNLKYYEDTVIGGATQFKIVAMRSVPTKHKDKPSG